MNDKISARTQYWLKNIVITILAAFSCKLFQLGAQLSDRQVDSDYSSLALTWVVVAFVITFRIAGKLGVDIINFCGLFFVSGFFIGTYDVFFDELVPPNYAGIMYRQSSDADIYENRWGQEFVQYNDPIKLGMLHNINNAKLKEDYELIAKDNQQIAVKAFLFWQTGVAIGFSPDESIDSMLSHGAYKKIWMIVSIGPMVLAEALVRSLIPHFFILFILRYFLYLKRPEDPWWILFR